MTKETILYAFDYDREKGILIWKNPPKNHLSLLGKEAGTVTTDGYKMTHFMKKHMLVHRIIYFIEKSEWPNNIDHINGEKLDNRIQNLRSVTVRENNENKKIHRNGKLIGAYWSKSRNKWRSDIMIEGKKKHIGSFDSEREAHEAYVIRRNAIDTFKERMKA